MNNIEIIIALLLLFMAVPDACAKLKRPALAYSVFVLFGLVIGPVLDFEVATMLKQAGKVGFLLLLFEVGLEIDLPRLDEFLPPLKKALLWMLVQYPVILLLAFQAGLNVTQSLLAAAALTGCSVGMAHSAWRTFPFSSAGARQFTLEAMVAAEMLSILAMAVGTTTLKTGLSLWIPVKLAGIAVVIFCLSRYATHLVTVFQYVIDRTTHWRLHWLALLVLAVCAIGQRLGLDGAKTAFVLGLCMSRARHRGMNLEDYMAPLSKRFLIPLFFVSLGLHVEWRMLFSYSALVAFGTAGVLLGAREIIHRRWIWFDDSGPAYLLLSPNLTLVALAASSMFEVAEQPFVAVWLLLTGLFITVPSLFLMPATADAAMVNADHVSQSAEPVS